MITKIPTLLDQYLKHFDDLYRTSLVQIPLFNPQLTAQFNGEQKKYFAAVFYHLRGHFINFMWYMANFSSSQTIKTLILNNIHEELGVGTLISHEMLYERFATECGVNIHDEIIHQTHYLPFAKQFNQKHIQWLATHSNEEGVAAFSAYERLDNIDYFYLLYLAKSFNLSSKALTFFKVHVHVKHFDATLDMLLPLWEQNPEQLMQSFDFIGNHQLTMWRNLSEVMFNYGRKQIMSLARNCSQFNPLLETL